MGFFKFLDGIMDPVLGPLFDIVNACIKMVELLVKLVKLIPELFATAMGILDPTNLLNDIIGGTFVAIKMIFEAFISMLSFKKFTDKHAPKNNNPSSGLFGYSKVKDKDGNYINPVNPKDRKCFPPTLFRLILLILCPPFALFLKVGLKRIIYVIICAILTIYGYYFPGLIYASLHVLC
jgi:uncharacterized membrane protein YqaE (UPF0057 family)